ncbi:MAG: AAC(3) family N-acetyltransferase [Bacilli bacterium]|nr:AAC(3) family N-acetyltransferase [Bacilli bacterium]
MNKQYEQLIIDIHQAGITKGMTVILHSSFKSLNLSKITPTLLINALQEVITKEGNLLIPTLTYKTVNKHNPVFAINTTPSDVGIVSETFRKMPDVYRSLNPIHSVAAWGKNAEELTGKHHIDDITLGYNSPFYLMLKYNAKICMLGCGLKPNTFMHLVENINNVPYRKTVDIVPFRLIDNNNQVMIKAFRLPSMSHLKQRYDRVINILDTSELHKATIGAAETDIIDANCLLRKAGLVLKDNPFYFVDEIKQEK